MYNLLLNPAKHLASMISFASMFHRHITFDFKYNAFYFHYHINICLGNVSVIVITPNILFPQ